MRAPAHGVRRAIVAVLATFVIAGALMPLWDRAAGAYAGVLAAASRPVAAWIEPAPLLERLERSGTLVRLAGRHEHFESLGAVETRTISFYLPFVVLLLAAAFRPLRLVTAREIAIILGAVLLVHVAGLALGIQVLEVDALRVGGSPSLAGPIENAILRTLHHTYCYTGAQLWAGLTIGLVLLRAGAGRSPSDGAGPSPRHRSIVAPSCAVLLLPAILYVGLAPALRHLTGRDRQASRTVAYACLRAGDRACARDLGARAIDPARPDPGTMMLLGLATEETAPAEAAGWYRRVVEARPHDSDARAGLARTLAKAGDREAAMAAYYALLSFEPGNPEAYRALADLHRARGNETAGRSHDELADRFEAGVGAAAVRNGR